LDELARSDGVRAVVLSGAGSVFCAGFDRSEFAGGGMEELFTEAMQYHRRGFVVHQPRLFGS
jgi:enoyl-CoA hydratase/carnithine racemase